MYFYHMRWLLSCLFMFALASCNQHDTKANARLINNKKPIVVLQTLGNISTTDLAFIQDSMQAFYPVTTVLAKEKQSPPHAWHAARKRWRADSIIAWLKVNTPDSVRLTVGLMTDDISTNKGNIADYGIMGLGYHPGKACVVSTYRLTKNIYSKETFKQRLFKVVAHEMGHNFGLPHCPNQHCIMVDAEGKMKLDGERDLCNDCRQKLKQLL